MMERSDLSLKRRPVIFGEVLFDSFPDGRDVLGGAPFNVARHLHGFGMNPLFISRVGNDPRGEKVRAAMADWEMDTDGLQRDTEHPTGTVRIAMQGTEHSFDILSRQAYDYIEADQALPLVKPNEAALLYFGSLIEREPVSRETLRQLRQCAIPLFSDVNLRDPWWSADTVASLLHGVKWVKLNNDELVQLGFDGEREAAARRMREQFGFELLVVTCGEEGALFVTADEVLSGAPVKVETMVDTVGAGDAFSAVVLLGLLQDWPLEKTLRHALAFASHLCEVRGAVLPDRRYYDTCLSQWNNSE